MDLQSAPPTPGTYFVRGARQLLTLRGPAPRRGLSCSDLGIIRDGSVLIQDGRIEEVGSTRRIENLRKARSARLIDVSGKVVAPGLIDSHLRLGEGPPLLAAFERRVAGLPASSPSPPAAAAPDRPELARRWTRLAAAGGATTIELRTGREADPADEMRALRAAAKLHGDPIEAIVGFTAAPVKASSQTARQAALERIEQVLRKAASKRPVASVFDLDCGERSIDWELARHCGSAALGFGYRLKIQADVLRSSGGVRLAVELGALSADRLDGVSEADIDLISGSATVATLLPNVSYHLGTRRFAPARRLLDRGAAVALASGFSPDVHPGFGLQMAMALACREMGLMPEEAIACCTINAAVAVGEASRIGSIEPNKEADLAVFDVEDYREIPYFFGVNLCWLTMKRGRVVYRAGVQAPVHGAAPRRKAE
jgi:imidazolonepropionase